LHDANHGWLLLGILFAGVENLLGTIRWRIFLRMFGMQVPFWKSMQVCLVALFCNTFLLGAAGGDLVRAGWLIRRGYGKTDSLLTVIMDRVSGLVGLLVYTLVFTLWNWNWLMRSSDAPKLFAGVIAYEIVAFALIAVTLVISARGMTNSLPEWAPFPDFVRKMGAGYAKFAHQPGGTVRACALSMVMLLGYFAVFWCSARAFGCAISFVDMATLMPVVDVISALPVSVGGMGMREGLFVILLGQLAGVPRATAFSISLIGYFVNVSWGLVGAAILPFFKGIVRDAREAAKTER